MPNCPVKSIAHRTLTAGGLCGASVFSAKARLLPRLMFPTATNYKAFLVVCDMFSIAETSQKSIALQNFKDFKMQRRNPPNAKPPRPLQSGRSFRRHTRNRVLSMKSGCSPTGSAAPRHRLRGGRWAGESKPPTAPLVGMTVVMLTAYNISQLSWVTTPLQWSFFLVSKVVIRTSPAPNAAHPTQIAPTVAGRGAWVGGGHALAAPAPIGAMSGMGSGPTCTDKDGGVELSNKRALKTNSVVCLLCLQLLLYYVAVQKQVRISKHVSLAKNGSRMRRCF
jgi:hypothetical protein